MSYAYDESPGFDDDSLFASGRAQHSFNGSHPSPAHNPHNRNRSHDRERMILDPDEDPNTPNQAHHRGARPGHPGGHVGSSYSISSAHSSHSRQHSALLSGSSSVPSPDRLSLAQQGHHSRGNGINSISSSSGGGGAISSSMNHSSMNHSSGSASSSLMDLDEEDERLYRPHPKQLLDRDEEALYARVQSPRKQQQPQQQNQQINQQNQQHQLNQHQQHQQHKQHQQHQQLQKQQLQNNQQNYQHHQQQPQPQSHNLSKHQSSSRVRPPPRSSVARAAAVSDDFAGDDDDEDEDPYASNGDTQRSDGVDADQAVQEEEGAQPLFVAELESSATLLTMLTCLPTLGRDKSKQHLTLTLIEEGIKISVAQAGSIYCRAYIKNSCFTTYKLLRKDVKLSLVQTQLLQCLQIFGQPARVSLTYRAEGAPLELSLHLGGIITKCAVYTLDREADIIDEVVPRRRAGEGDSEFSSSKNSSNRSSSSSISGRRGDKHNSHGNHANNSNAGDTAGKGGKNRIAGGGGGDSVGFSANPRSRMVSHPPPRSAAAASPNSGSGMESDDSASPSLSSSVSISALSPSARASSSSSSSKSSKPSKSANSSSSSKSSSKSSSVSSRSHNNNNPDNPQWLFDMHRTVARATMRSAVLKDALAELDVNGVEALRFQWTHRAPFLSMRCLGDSVKCIVEFPRDGDRRQEVFSEFECEPEIVRSEYSMHLIRACARSLAKSNEAYLRVNEIGMLSLQQMITQDQPVGNWLDIAIMPQAEHRDLPAEGEAEL